MKKYLLFFIINIIIIGNLFSQTPISKDSLSGPDLIVLRSGKVIRAKVIDIGVDLIKYKRAEYLNGPTYSIYRNQVYAVNYPDGKADYFLPVDSTAFYSNDNNLRKPQKIKVDTSKKFNFANNPQASIGLGFLKSYSIGDEFSSNLKQTSLLPGIYLRYTTEKNESLRFGVQLGIARYNYEGDEFNEFDQVIVSRTASENVFSLSAFGQYTLNTGTFKPYILGGLSLNIATIDGQTTVLPVETGAGYRVNDGARDISLGILARIGAIYSINDKIQAYLDAGSGLSIIQLGAIFNLGN